MATIHLRQMTSSTSEQFVAALADFGPGRQKVFARSAHDYLKLHELGSDHADVTEGSGGRVGAPALRLIRFPVVMPTTDSNTWGRPWSHTSTLTWQADGMTVVDVVVVREASASRRRPGTR